jgi:thiamine pyrophosphate-dependent acetolactate synthase large subunit-like protein
MLLLSGSSFLAQKGKGGFQEFDELALCKPYAKYAAQLDNVRDIPQHLSQAFLAALQGRPGPSFIGIVHCLIWFDEG